MWVGGWVGGWGLWLFCVEVGVLLLDFLFDKNDIQMCLRDREPYWSCLNDGGKEFGTCVSCSVNVAR